MADKYLLEDGSGGYLLEDDGGVVLLEAQEEAVATHRNWSSFGDRS